MVYALLSALVVCTAAAQGIRRSAEAAVDDVRAARRQVRRLRARLAELPDGPDRDRLSARLADVERVEAAFVARGRPRLGGWRRPFALGLTLDE